MIEQRSPEWFAQRLGYLTASRMADMLATTKSGPAASRVNLIAQLVCERLTGKPADLFESADMRRGTELEPLARAAYEAFTGEFVTAAEFVRHPTIAWLGASPDGYVRDTGLVEVKCLNAANHIAVLRTGNVTKYVPQVQTQMLCTGRQWCDLAFFHPDFPEHLQLEVVRVPANESEQMAFAAAATIFLEEVAAEVAALTELKRAA